MKPYDIITIITSYIGAKGGNTFVLATHAPGAASIISYDYVAVACVCVCVFSFLR